MDQSVNTNAIEKSYHPRNGMHHGPYYDSSHLNQHLSRQRRLKHLAQISPRQSDTQNLDDQLGLLTENHHPNQLFQALKKYLEINSEVLVPREEKSRWVNPALSDKQRTAISDYSQLVSRRFFRRSSKNRPPLMTTIKATLEEYFDALDAAIFFGSLRDQRTIIFVEKIDGAVEGGEILGECHWSRSGFGEDSTRKFACLIEVSATHGSSHQKDADAHLFDCVASLLHEMLHAYFFIYTCRCAEGCDRAYNTLIGPQGHQQAWQQAALLIEDSTERLLGRRIDMNRFTSLLGDWSSTGLEPAWFFMNPTQYALDPNSLRAGYHFLKQQQEALEKVSK